MSDRIVKVSLIAQVGQYVADLQKAQQATSKTSTEVEKLAAKRQAFETLAKGAVVFGGAITAVGVAALKTGIAYNTLQQQARAALTTLLGDAKAANAQMDRLDDFARTSPFAKQVFIKAQQQMLAFGIETKKVIPYLDAVQDAVAAMGGSNADIEGLVAILAKIRSSAKITGEDLMQFGNRGVDAAALIGSQMGKTAQQIRADITDGALDAQVALDALADGMKERFGGAAANVKNTFVGSVDRIKAAWRDFSSELAKPLVDPNGGGALIGLLNWAADMMRAFIKLPEPVKVTTSVLVGLVGVVSLIGGTAILAIPKLVAFRVALDTIAASSPRLAAALGGVQLAATRTTSALGATTRFLTGPWGVALAAAVVGVKVLADYLDSLRASTAELENSAKTAKNAADIWNTLAKGRDVAAFADVRAQLEDLPTILAAAAEQSGNFWSRFTGRESFGAIQALRDLGGTLAATAQVNLPEAQRQFKLLSDEYKLNERDQWRLLSTMSDYRDMLTRVATEQGINVTSTNEAANKANLLKIALGEIAITAPDAAAGVQKLSNATNEHSEAVAVDMEALVKWQEMVMGADAAFIDLLGGYEAVIKANQEHAQSVAASSESSKDSWQDYYDGFTVMVDDYLAELERQQQAQSAWEQNMVLLSSRVSQGVLDHLVEMGPKGAPLVAELVNASDEQLARLETVFGQQGVAATGKFTQTLRDAAPIIEAASEQLGEGAAREIAEKLSNGTYTVQQIMREYGLKIEEVRPTVHVNADTSGAEQALARVRDALRGIDGATAQATVYGNMVAAGSDPLFRRARGGILPGAPSRRDNMLIAAASGEFVTRAHQAAIPENRRALEYMNAGGVIRGYATGGLVQYATPSPAITVNPSIGVPAINVVVKPKGGINLLDYVDVQIENAERGRETVTAMGWSVNR